MVREQHLKLIYTLRLQRIQCNDKDTDINKALEGQGKKKKKKTQDRRSTRKCGSGGIEEQGQMDWRLEHLIL